MPSLCEGDEIQLAAIAGYFAYTHNIPKHLIKRNWYLLFEKKSCKIIGLFERLGANAFGTTVMNQPDIVLLDHSCKKIKLLIELDGSSHNKKQAQKKTQIRNSRYARAKIPFVIIDIKKFRKQQIDWFEYLDHILAKYKIIPNCKERYADSKERRRNMK